MSANRNTLSMSLKLAKWRPFKMKPKLTGNHWNAFTKVTFKGSTLTGIKQNDLKWKDWNTFKKK